MVSGVHKLPNVYVRNAPMSLGFLVLFIMFLGIGCNNLGLFSNRHRTLTSCVPMAKYPSISSLPRLYAFAGVEGSGQDFWDQFFRFLPINITKDMFEPALHLTVDPHQEMLTTNGEKYNESCPKLPYPRQAADFGSQILNRLDNVEKREGETRKYYLRARDPFMMGRIRTPLARPDLLNLARFHGVYYDLKLLVLIRNLTESIAWSVSRDFHANDVGLQVRLVEDSLTVMDAQIRLLPCSTYAAVNLNMVTSKPEAVASQIAKFLDHPGVGPTECLRALQSAYNVWLSPPFSQVPMFNGEPVESFFNKRHTMWPLVNSCHSVRYFQPNKPSKWPRS